jgi:F0F1-type ATP synthase assembly protein I
MKKTKAPITTLSPKQTATNETVRARKNEARILFFGAVIDMTWQMAVVVLVPILGGFELDKVFHTSPVLIIVGFILAMVGTYMVIKHALDVYNERTVSMPKEGK